MNSERDLIARIESADVPMLAQLLQRPTRRDEEVLRTYFGDGRYRSMRSLALQTTQRSATAATRGNVVVLHGIMGGELTRVPAGKAGIHFWMNLPRIAWGEFSRCRLNDDGRSEQHDIRATGILKRYYGELLLYLAAQNWNVRPFWYDWRKDVRAAASSLESFISTSFDDDQPVHLVGHSMGGLVARTFARQYPERWQKLAKAGSRLIMLGTPNFGSFSITQVLTGTESTVKLLARLDLWNSLRGIREIASTFPGCYQMLPSSDVMPSMQKLYEADTWARLPGVSRRHLQAAREFQHWLNHDVDPQPIYIAGYNKPTAGDIRHNQQGQPDFDRFKTTDFERAKNEELYQFTADGDGTVPHSLGFLNNGQQVFNKVYFVEEEHGRLPVNRQVMEAVVELLQSGETNILPSTKPASRTATDERQLAEQWRKMHEPDEKQAEVLATQIATRARGAATPVASRAVPLTPSVDETAVPPPDSAAADQMPVSRDERNLENAALRSFLYDERQPARQRMRQETEGELPTVEIGLVRGNIEDLGMYEMLAGEGAPVDCISVGHYIGVRPQQAERALDTAVSQALLQRARRSDTATDTPLESEQPGDDPLAGFSDRDLVLTQFTDRGTLHGQLGQPFFLADPRAPADERLIAIAGMGLPGRFGMPELTVLARELVWALGRLGKRHLLTVLIGGGRGNLPTADAVLAWRRGIAQAIGGAFEQDAKRLQRVTFVECDPRQMEPLRDAIQQVASRPDTVKVQLHLPTDEQLSSWREEALQWARDEYKSQLWKLENSADFAPTRMTVQMAGDAYHFGAITEDASIPERVIKIDSRIVLGANDMLAAAWDHFEQREQGRFLERLLIPHDLRGHLATRAPLVVVLDRTTARLHWELVAQPDPLGDAAPAANPEQFNEDSFLGTARGLTRQFRTILAPLPEPPPPPRRVLRVLVVADPAADASLPGAEQEGSEVADLFESFNTHFADRTHNRVEVQRLIGPYEATIQNVLKHLLLEKWDVLHFAGHCFYNANDPPASGWIFDAKENLILSANELNRIDRVPKFVFSNACESGVTPDRAEKRDPRIAPSFAEAFFERGVANFVCTAWPVEDVAAREFANRLYAGLLGLSHTLKDDAGASGRSQDRNTPPCPESMHQAMRAARIAIGHKGGRTWAPTNTTGTPTFGCLTRKALTKTTRNSGLQ